MYGKRVPLRCNDLHRYLTDQNDNTATPSGSS